MGSPEALNEQKFHYTNILGVLPTPAVAMLVKKYNAEIVEDLGVEIPDDYIAIE